ncbi:helix-turn-helix domain-containing protein [Streptomyces tauricus]|uniref:helix-turn-helix domain-containing protein n=1 Tax=Streptomyces tauricus TaxID=68274 RepID=UPI003440A97B
MTRTVPSPPGARLADVLQQLKQRTGLSLAQLANVTTFSKSSWERYLNGKSLPPRSAVIELCRLVGEAPDHSLALLDLARTHRTPTTHGTPRTDTSEPTRGTPAVQRSEKGQGTDKSPPAPAAPPEATPPDTDAAPTPAHTRPTNHRPVTVLTALVSVCAVAIGALVLIHLPPSRDGRTASPSPTPPPATGALCRHKACQDKDPITTRCAAEPMTLAEHETATGAWIQIRYSQECGASWVRMWGAAMGDHVELRAGGGRGGSRHGARVASRNEADTYVHTRMSVVSPGTRVQACFSPAAGGTKECVRTHPNQSVATPHHG